MEHLLAAVGNVGFPIAVATYLLVRVEAKIDASEDKLNKIKTQLDRIEATLKRIEEK